MDELHGKSHIGRDKIIDLINTRFYWPNYWQDVYNYVNSCSRCLKFKVNNHPSKGAPRVIDTPNNVCEEWELDFFGPFDRSESGNIYILTAMDLMSRFVMVHPSKNQTEKTVINFLRNYLFSTFGYPCVIRTDGGPCFRGNELRHWLEIECKIALKQGASYDSDSHSCIERTQGTILNNLRATIGDNIRQWDIHVKLVAFLYNCSTHSSIKESPYFLMFGREPRLNTSLNLPVPVPCNLDKGNGQNIITAFTKYRISINQQAQLKSEERRLKRQQPERRKEFNVGDVVLVEKVARSRNKLDAKFKGPYEVVNKWHGDNYTLVLQSTKNLIKPRKVTIHVDKIRKYVKINNQKDKTNEDELSSYESA